MKILFIAATIPYDLVPHAGGQTLNFYIKKFAENPSNKVRLTAYCTREELGKVDCRKYNIEFFPILKPQGVRKYVIDFLNINSKINTLHKYANIMTYTTAKLLKNELRSMKNNGYYPDIIIMEWTQISIQVDNVKRIFPKAKLVASEHDVTYQGKYRYFEIEKRKIIKKYKHLQANNMKRREINAFSKCHLVVTHNVKDKKILISDGIEDEKIHTIVPYFHRSSLLRDRKNNDIIFYGSMNRYENEQAVVWFIEQVMPKIHNNEVRFVIVGNKPSDRLRRLSENNKKRIILTGYVDSIDPFFSEAMCFVCPLFLGAGIKVKVLEALYSGIPVITNEVGIEGIPAVNGRDYIKAESADEYVDAIDGLISGRITEDELCGKMFIENYFSYEISFNEYQKKLMEITLKSD